MARNTNTNQAEGIARASSLLIMALLGLRLVSYCHLARLTSSRNNSGNKAP